MLRRVLTSFHGCVSVHNLGWVFTSERFPEKTPEESDDGETPSKTRLLSDILKLTGGNAPRYARLRLKREDYAQKGVPQGVPKGVTQVVYTQGVPKGVPRVYNRWCIPRVYLGCITGGVYPGCIPVVYTREAT